VSAAYYLRRPSSSAFLAETKLRFNFGKGIKEPSTPEQANQLYALLTPALRSQFGVDPVGPERSRTLDFGLAQGVWNGRARLELTYFYNRFYDLITYLNPAALISVGVNPDAATASGEGAYVNASSTRSKGLEAEFITDFGHGLRVQANYTNLNAIVTKAFGAPAFNPDFPGIPIGAFSPLEGQRPFHRAPNSGSVGLLYSHGKFTGSLTGYVVGRRDDSTFLSDGLYGNTMLLPNRDLAPAYQKFDLSGRYALRPFVSLYSSMENLLSEHYQATFGYPAAPFTIRAGATFTIGGEAWKK
jgi:iron complex outermembrane receptor protein/vitamin B12 transporter